MSFWYGIVVGPYIIHKVSNDQSGLKMKCLFMPCLLAIMVLAWMVFLGPFLLFFCILHTSHQTVKCTTKAPFVIYARERPQFAGCMHYDPPTLYS